MFKAIINFFKRLFGWKTGEEKKPVGYIPNNNFDQWSHMEKNVFMELNFERVQEDKPAFFPEGAGQKECHNRLKFLYDYYKEYGKLSHEMVGTSIKNLNRLGFKDVHEVIGLGWYNQNTLVDQWEMSESHNEVIKGDYKYCGIGYGENEDGIRFYVGLMYN